jgi:hypothetical protein
MAALDLKLERLFRELRALGPVVGVDGVVGDVTPAYDPEPTTQQRTAVEAAIAAFDWSDAADDEWLANLNPDRKALLDQATAAVIRLNQIIDSPDPAMTTLNQVVSALKNQILPAIRDMALYEKHIIKRLVQVP